MPDFGLRGWFLIGLTAFIAALLAIGSDPAPPEDPLDPDIFS
jgi:hypothetical protein